MTTPTARRKVELSLMLNITGSAPTWTPENRGWNMDLFKYGNQQGWGYIGHRWLDQCLPRLDPAAKIIVHACQQVHGPTDTYPMNAHADGWTERNFGPFSALTDRRVLVYAGGIYSPSKTCGRDMAYCAAYFGFGYIEPHNEVALDAFAGSAQNIKDAGANWLAYRRQSPEEYFEPWAVYSVNPVAMPGIIRTETEYHRNNDQVPPWAANDFVPVYCIIDDLPAGWAAYSHRSRVEWTLAKCKAIVARHPNHRPVITAINGSPDTGRSIAPDVLAEWAKQQGATG